MLICVHFYFFLQYLLFVLLCFAGFAAAGILGLLTSMDWSAILTEQESLPDIVNIVPVVEDILDSLMATSVSILKFCFILRVTVFTQKKLTIINRITLKDVNFKNKQKQWVPRGGGFT